MWFLLHPFLWLVITIGAAAAACRNVEGKHTASISTDRLVEICGITHASMPVEKLDCRWVCGSLSEETLQVTLLVYFCMYSVPLLLAKNLGLEKKWKEGGARK